MAGQEPVVTTRTGALGPRLIGRLTAELILRSPQFMNPLKHYEIDLRGNKIAAIENLGATENQFDTIDLSDNAIVRLEGFPRLLRLKEVFLNNNRIGRIEKTVSGPIPNVETLILTNNRISNLQDLDPLAGFKKLTLLSLIGNPVVTKPNYRLYVIAKCKALKVLDFKKVKQKEREEAVKMFPTDEAAAQHSAKTFEVDADYEAQTAALQQQQAQEAAAAASAASEAAAGAKSKGPSQQELVAIKAAIANATTMEEIRRLEEALTTGQQQRASQHGLNSIRKSYVAQLSDGISQQLLSRVPSEFRVDQGQAADGDAVMADGGQQAQEQQQEPHANGNKPDDMAVG